MEWGAVDLWIVAIGTLCAMACALLGNFLVLRRMSLMGDAISHAVLPGLVIAFLATGTRSLLPMFAGAMAAGALTVLLTFWIHRLGRIDRGASMGIVFTTLFALGLLLLEQARSSNVDLDADCVLFGDLLWVSQNVAWEWDLGRHVLAVPRGALTLGCVFLLDLGFVLLLLKELRISTFDPELADTLGFRSAALQYLLMILVALTAVAAFEAVGSILVIAMLIIPPATAHLLSDRLGGMIAASLLAAALCAPAGHALATLTDTETSGMMAVSALALFLLAALLAPRHGWLARRRLLGGSGAGLQGGQGARQAWPPPRRPPAAADPEQLPSRPSSGAAVRRAKDARGAGVPPAVAERLGTGRPGGSVPPPSACPEGSSP